MRDKTLLIVVFGLPGTGKTSFAKALATELHAVHLNSDKLRFQQGKSGHYDKDTKATVYKDLLETARKLLEKENTVVLDATFSKQGWRNAVEQIAKDCKVPVNWIVIRADEDVVRKRVSQKRQYTEADFEVYKKIKEEYDPILMDHFVLESDSLTLDEMVKKAMKEISPGSP